MTKEDTAGGAHRGPRAGARGPNESGLLSICLSSRTHNTSCEGVVGLKSATAWVVPLLMVGL